MSRPSGRPPSYPPPSYPPGAYPSSSYPSSSSRGPAPARREGERASLEVRRARRVLVAFAALGALLAAAVGDAYVRRARRAQEAPAIRAVAQVLPSNDLALSGGARWLRAPSMEEPGAAFADAPALPDPDPAGGVMAPPRDVWAAAARGPSPAASEAP